jgi:hypothetical protein
MDYMGPDYVREHIDCIIKLMAQNAKNEFGIDMGTVSKTGLKQIVLGAVDVFEGKPWPHKARLALRAARKLKGKSDKCVQWKAPRDRPARQYDRLVITVATGASDYFSLTLPRHSAYAKKINATHVVLSNGKQEWWGLEKFRVYAYAKRARQCLFIDADVLVHNETPDIFELHRPGKVLIYDDFPNLNQNRWGIANNTKWLPAFRAAMLHSQYRDLAQDDGRCLNTGVVVTDQETSACWKPPKHPFVPHHCSEQLWVDHQIREGWLQSMEEMWNFQWWRSEFDDAWSSALMPHLSSMSQWNVSRFDWIKENCKGRKWLFS